ncbi:MAG: tetratricopeptide repeat protein [Phycisphaerae bacterium]|nr:tetratricopeptide repeat protein [Phycisphaerae bacterium]
MATLRSTTISLLLVMVAITTPALSEPASVLLQEGLYAEEIEGDLDAAIKIYEKIIAQAEQTQQAAGLAMYRIGICHLKKGDKTQAANQFQQIIEKFPAQKSLVAKARSQIAKIQPASVASFRAVIDSSTDGKVYFYDFDKEKVFPRPEWLTRDSPMQKVAPWGRKNGIDFIIGDDGDIELADMIAVKVAYGLWDSAGPVEINAALDKGPQETISLEAPGEGIETSAPITYVFQTREGGLGMLQILGKKDNNVRIRYKMLRSVTSSAEHIQRFGRVIERVINSEDSGKGFFYDLDAAKAVSPPEGLRRDSSQQEVTAWNRKNGIDLVNDREMLGLADMVAVEVSNRLWDSGAPAEISGALKNASSKRMLVASPNTTYAFKTREGGFGILQIFDITGKDLRFRYKMLSDATAVNLYEQLPLEVIRFVGNKYGTICAEAGEKKLYSNSHIYYVTSDFVLAKGGMGYYHNISDRALFNKIRLCGTSYPNQTHYDIGGRKMNTEIVPDKGRPNFHHIYWTPHEPVPPGQMFYYGWCLDQSKQLRPASSPGQYKLTMQNQFGSRVMEAFFLIVPKGMQIVSRTENYTAKDTVGGFDIYCFSKEVPMGTNHQVDLVLAGPVEDEGSTPVQSPANLYEHLPNDVLQFVAGNYGSISAQAGAKSLYSNSHIYYVKPEMTLLSGGMGYYYNRSDQPQSGRIRLSGTSDPDQSLYDAAGREMNIEIVADGLRARFYHIYWTPSEPIPPGQMFYYGWSSDDVTKLNRTTGTKGYNLKMQNRFGDPVIETFFLVVPAGTEIVGKTEDYTAKETVGGFDIYYFSKELPPNTNHRVDLVIAPPAKLSGASERTNAVEAKRRQESEKKLLVCARSLLMYANDNDGKLPAALRQLQPYVPKRADFQLMVDNVEYLGKGKSAADASHTVVVAYEKTPLEKDKGTHALFIDGHVEFVPAKRCKELGIAAPPLPSPQPQKNEAEALHLLKTDAHQ